MNMYALLIGINYYLPNRLSNGLYYKSLAGCVQDVTRVEQFLRNVVGVSEDRLIKLTSSYGDEGPAEPPAQWPTYANIVNAFGKLAEMISAGDQVYIHYSGHGGRCPTTPEFREMKGPNGLDEVLVPMDLGDSEGRYLRDTEMHYLLQRLVDKKCFLTLVLDSCHAGGATRARVFDEAQNETTVRGVSVIDYTPRVQKSLVASPGQLVETWKHSFGEKVQRSVKSDSAGWLEPQGYVLLAACRASEYANEYPFDGNEKNGALTYWWLDGLKQLKPGVTYKMLHDRVLARVRGQFPDQTPQLQGEGNRVVFGCDEILVQDAVTVIEVQGSDHIVLNAGQVHGVEQGAKFSVFALNERDFSQQQKRIATVEVVKAGATSSTARILSLAGSSMIEPGCQAILFDVGKRQLRRRVRLVGFDEHQEAFNQIKEALASTSSGFLQLGGDEEGADYLVTVSEQRVVICHPNGLEIENLEPPIPIGAADFAIRLMKRLVHLAKFYHVRALQNDHFTPFADKVSVALNGSFGEPGYDIPTVEEGDTTVLRVRNNSEVVLNFTVLDLQPDWGISQIYPSRAGAFESLDPGQEFNLPMRVLLPPGYTEGTDVIKVFATNETTSFRWFELPPMEASAQRRGNALQDLVSTIASEESITRQVEVLTDPELEWTVHQVEIDIKAAKAASAFSAES